MSHNVVHDYPKHSHSGYTFGVIDRGIGGNLCRGKKQLSPSGTVVVMNPEEVHTGFAVEGACSYRMLYVSEVALKSYLPAKTSLPYFKNNVVENNQIAAALAALHECLRMSTEILTYQTQFVVAMRRIARQYARDHTDVSTTSTAPHQPLQVLRDYLDSCYAQNISLDDLVSLSNLHRATVIRQFHKHVGLPPHRYLVQRRVEAAKGLLRRGEAAATVALHVGFSDQSHLTRHFKRLTGVTPSAYAKGDFCSRQVRS
ncbi:MAG: AraC family transcriptional regulator [Deinococcota bacterium]